MPATDDLPRIGLTMGDLAGVGPEVIACAWSDRNLHRLCRPLVIGDPDVLRKAIWLVGGQAGVVSIDRPELAEPSTGVVPCLAPPSIRQLGPLIEVPSGQVDRRAGRAAYDCLISAIDLALEGRIDAITTLPLNKESLRTADIPQPGHTEILAERCQTPDYAMMLYLAAHPPRAGGEEETASRPGLGVVHVTLHVALRQVFTLVSTEAVASKIRLADRAMRLLTSGRQPLIAVSSLNPHAGENGLFGDEEIQIIPPPSRRCKPRATMFTARFPMTRSIIRHLAGRSMRWWPCITIRGISP